MEKSDSQSCSCSGTKPGCSSETRDEPWVTGRVPTPEGEIKQVSTSLSFRDTLGSWKARWGINRMNYKIDPGLYCTGNPGENSPILVTANYKMSFDRLRRELGGVNAWILVLDTKGINVWCAAGKGTFGTCELINRIRITHLADIVKKKVIILPQLGAPGVEAHEVQRNTGFKVIYGPVRANDIKEFINNGMTADKAMRTVKFTFTDRLVLTPMEIVNALKPSLIIFGVLFILNSLGFGSYGLPDICAYVGAVFAGCVITPVLLPWIPGRAFAFKGALAGLLWAIAFVLLNGLKNLSTYELIKVISFILILPAVSSYYAMNFTGCSTYTSLSGVNKEMKIAVPIMITAVSAGIALLVAGSIVRLIV